MAEVQGIDICMRCLRESRQAQSGREVLTRLKDSVATGKAPPARFGWCPQCYAAPSIEFFDGWWQVSCCGLTTRGDTYDWLVREWNGHRASHNKME